MNFDKRMANQLLKLLKKEPPNIHLADLKLVLQSRNEPLNACYQEWKQNGRVHMHNYFEEIPLSARTRFLAYEEGCLSIESNESVAVTMVPAGHKFTGAVTDIIGTGMGGRVSGYGLPTIRSSRHRCRPE